MAAKPPVVYYVLGGPNEEYKHIFYTSLQSLRRHNPDLHVLCLCDARFVGAVQAVIADDLHATCVPAPMPLTSCVAASMHKLAIFDTVPDLCDRYGTVLYLDCDVVVLGDLLPLLQAPFSEHVLCVATEDNNLLESYYANQGSYSYEDLAVMEANGICRPFNAGQFMFHANETMRGHFRAIQQSVNSFDGPFFYEQSFMNPHFNKQPLRCRDDALLGSVTLLHGPTSVPDRQSMNGKLLVHFYGAHVPLAHKLMFMRTTYLLT